VVLKLQNRVRTSFDIIDDAFGQIVIYGEDGHAEVNGLVGQTNGKAIIVRTEADLEKIDFKLPVHFFSQTTKSTAGFKKMKEMIEDRVKQNQGLVNDENFESNDTLCRQVSNREPRMQRFSNEHDVVVFVSGKKSSNGKALYSVCKAVNERAYFISEPNEIDASWFNETDNVGICGATSTPMWLMQDVADRLKQLFVVETV
jgi:4-hydroxy-3-methylbut-2-enyl diphosphate reductase